MSRPLDSHITLDGPWSLDGPGPANDTSPVLPSSLAPVSNAVPHLLIPFAISSTGAPLTVQQDTSDEIVQSVAYLVGTRPGTRLMSPKYGITDPTFEGIDQMELQLSAATWEPRATVSVNTTPANVEYVTVQVGQR